MGPDVILLPIVLFFVVPALWAALYLKGGSTLGIPNFGSHRLKMLFDVQSRRDFRELRRISKPYEIALKEYEQIGIALTKAMDEEHRMLESLRKNHATAKPVKSQAIGSKIATPASEAQPNSIKARLASQRDLVSTLREQLSKSESDLSQAYQTWTGAIAQFQSRKAQRAAEQLLNKTDTAKVSEVIEYAEKVVRERELASHHAYDSARAQAAAAKNKTVKTTFDEALQRVEKAVHEKEVSSEALPNNAVEESQYQLTDREKQFVEGVASLIDLAPRTVAKAKHLFSSVDPSIHRAYLRLRDQFQEATASLDKSMREEELLEHAIKHHELRKINMLERFNHFREIDPAVHTEWHRKLAIVEETITDLAAALKVQNRKNVISEQRLFRVEQIIIQLEIVKRLLDSLARQEPSESLNEFKRVVAQTCNYLASDWRDSQESTKPEEGPNLAERFTKLKERVLMAFIKIARGDETHQHYKSEKFMSALHGISMHLELTHVDLYFKVEEWQNLAAQCAADNKPLLNTLAVQRSEQCSETLAFIIQSLEVLEVTQALITQRAEAKGKRTA